RECCRESVRHSAICPGPDAQRHRGSTRSAQLPDPMAAGYPATFGFNPLCWGWSCYIEPGQCSHNQRFDQRIHFAAIALGAGYFWVLCAMIGGARGLSKDAKLKSYTPCVALLREENCANRSRGHKCCKEQT